MDDLISRQAAIEAFAKWFFEVFGIRESDGTATIFKRLREIPSAQPEIIRCKNCEHFELDKPEIIRCKDCRFYPNHGYKKDVVFDKDACHWNADEMPDPDDYCSAAERREE